MLTALGIAAASCTILSFVVQTAKIIYTRKTSGLSLPMWCLSAVAFVIWIIYGAVRAEPVIVVPNAVCVVLTVVIIVMIVRQKRGSD